jgi:hypothetical protein
LCKEAKGNGEEVGIPELVREEEGLAVIDNERS